MARESASVVPGRHQEGRVEGDVAERAYVGDNGRNAATESSRPDARVTRLDIRQDGDRSLR